MANETKDPVPETESTLTPRQRLLKEGLRGILISEENNPLDEIAFFADALNPGTSEAWKRLAAALKKLADPEALRDGDPHRVSAARVVQAVLVAVGRSDDAALAALQSWERQTFAYMKEHALDDYVCLPLPPRERLDRHIVIRAVLAQIKRLLTNPPFPEQGLFEVAMLVGAISMLIKTAFPNLHEVEGTSVEHVIHERFEKHIDKYGSVAAIDPEAILVDGFAAFGISAQKVRANWLPGARPGAKPDAAKERAAPPPPRRRKHSR